MEFLKREEVLTSFQQNSSEVIRTARDEKMNLTDYLESVTEPNKDDDLSVVDWMLWREGFNLHDHGYKPASPMRKLGDWSDKNIDNNPATILFFEKMSDRFVKTLSRGLKNVKYRPPTHVERATDGASMIAKIEAGTAMNLYDDSDFYRAQRFGPTIDWMQIVGMAQTTESDEIRKNKYNNSSDDRKMRVTPEAVGPVRMELAYSKDLVEFTPYGIAIEATYDFLNASQTRASAIMNAIDEVALQYRTIIFEGIVKEIVSALPSGHAIDPSGSGLTSKVWREFRMKYNHYSLDIVLGNAQSIAQFEEMMFGTGDTTAAFIQTMWEGMIPGIMSPRLLNNQPMIPNYGWYDDLATQLPDNSLLTFDQMYSSEVWFKRSLDQDESKRDPEDRTVTRYLNTQVGFNVPDPHGIYTLDIA